MALTASCATPTTPKFPEPACVKIEMTKEELKELSLCNKDVVTCSVQFNTLKKIFNIVQEKSACIEQYKAAASKFKG